MVFFYHHHHQYKHLFKDLIVQCLLRLKESSVLLCYRKEDLHMVESMLDDARDEYFEKAKVHTPDIIVDKDIFFPPAPSDDDPHALTGEVVRASRDGKIVCENTLDARLEVGKKLPEIRKSLFGKVGAA